MNWRSHVLEPFTTAVYLPIALFLWTVVLLAVSLVQLLVHMVIRMRRRRDAVTELG